MKYIKRTIIPLLLLISFVPLTKVQATSLDAEIAKIKSAPPHLRVKLMNRLKQKIWRMRQAQRLRAIKRLRRKIPTSNRVATHTAKHTVEFKNRVSTAILKQRMEITNHNTVTTMAHDLGKSHKHTIMDKHTTQQNHIVTTNEEHSIDTPNVHDSVISKISTPHTDITVSQNQNNPTTIHPDTGTTKEVQNTPLKVLDAKPSDDSSNRIVETNQNQQTIVIDNSIKTEQSNQVTMTNNQQEQTINTTQSSNINLNNSIKTEQSNQVTMTNNQQEQTIQVTQPNTNSHTIKVDNSAQTDIKVINAESKPIIHQDNTVKESNIEVNQEVHIEEHRHISNSSSQSSSNVVSTPIQHSLTPTSQRTTKRLDVRSLRIYIQNRSRRR